MDENGIDEDEVQFLSSTSLVNKFSGEDLCERANIYRRNGYKKLSVPLNNFNEGFVESMVRKESEESTDQNRNDYEIESIVQSILDMKANGSAHTSSSDDDNESIEELLNESEIDVNWEPNVLKKPQEEEFVESFYSSIMDFDDSMFSCLSFNSMAALPYDSVQKAFSFNKSFLERLKRIQCKDVRLQLYSWPSIIKGISITCVSSPKSGKTNSYLVPLMNWFDSREVQDSKQDIKIGAIVLCSSTRQTYDIARQAKQWRDPDTPPMEQTIRIVSMNSMNEKKQFSSILNGCDILVTTPGPLLHAIESSLIDSSSTRSLIIDDADVTLALHGEAVRKIYMSYASLKKGNKRFVQKNGTVSNPMAFQTLVFAQRLTNDVKWFSQEYQHKPSVIFGSYYETSIALKVECRVEVIESEMDREKAVQLLTTEAFEEYKRIAFVCRNEDEMRFLKRQMKKEVDEKYTIVVTQNTPHYELESKRTKWNSCGRFLFITDEAIKIVEGFQTCYCIIHYKLPKDFVSDFGERFRLMRKQFQKLKNPFETKNLPKLLNYVVVSPSDNSIPELITYLKRLEVVIPPKLISLCDYERRPLCINFASFGKCPFGPVYCPDRHLFNKYDCPQTSLPQNGQIKIVMTYVMGANQFYFRLQEFRNETNTSGQWTKMENTYDEIRPQLNALKDSPFNTIKNVCFEKVYGIAVRAEVLRVRVLRLIGEQELQFYEEYDPNDKNLKIELFCIDFGHKLRSRLRQLFELPEKLRHLPPFAYKGYLFGIKPVDNEIEWDFRATQKFYDLVENFRITKITAWILKQIDGVFWLNQMNVEKRLKSAKMIVGSKPEEYLIENHFVEQNDNSLQDINTDYHRIVNIWHNYSLNSVVYHSCLVDSSTYVVVTDFVSLNHFYVMKEKEVQRLQELENKWLQSMSDSESLNEVIDSQMCFYKGTDKTTNEEYVNRIQVVAVNDSAVNVFLVDHGETIKNVPKNRLFRIAESYLRELPFQAIKVALFGVKQIKPITYDLICDLTRNESDEYKMSIADKQSYDNGVHTIRLFVAQNDCETHFVALSKLLVDLGYAEYVDSEDDKELEVIIQKELDDPNEEPDTDYIINEEEYMANNFFKDLFLQWGFSEDDLKPSPSQPAVKESRVSKTLRRLRAIKAMNNRKEESGDESDDEYKPFPKKIVNNSGDYDYEMDANAPLQFFDGDDHLDEGCDHSDEDGFLEDEDLS